MEKTQELTTGQRIVNVIVGTFGLPYPFSLTSEPYYSGNIAPPAALDAEGQLIPAPSTSSSSSAGAPTLPEQPLQVDAETYFDNPPAIATPPVPAAAHPVPQEDSNAAPSLHQGDDGVGIMGFMEPSQLCI